MAGIPIADDFALVSIPIREDAVARIHFPKNITKAEAEKVARVILAYAAEPEPAA